MSVIIRVIPDVSDWITPSEVTFDYGEIADDFTTVEELLKKGSVNPADCRTHVYPLSGDAQKSNNATHLVAVWLGSDPLLGKTLWMDEVIDGSFILMLSVGDKLKGFHCDECARGWAYWWLERQSYWRELYHGTKSPQNKNEKTTLH